MFLAIFLYFSSFRSKCSWQCLCSICSRSRVTIIPQRYYFCAGTLQAENLEFQSSLVCCSCRNNQAHDGAREEAGSNVLLNVVAWFPSSSPWIFAVMCSDVEILVKKQLESNKRFLVRKMGRKIRVRPRKTIRRLFWKGTKLRLILKLRTFLPAYFDGLQLKTGSRKIKEYRLLWIPH